MLGLYKGCFTTICILLSGVIAVTMTIPLMASWFGVTLTITGAAPVAGMYLYLLSSLIVSVGLFFGIGLILLFVVALIGMLVTVSGK